MATSRPKPPVEISWFWQNTQRRVQPEKKTAPEPHSPEMGGSSQKWSAERAASGRAPMPQKPVLPWARSAPQRLGQSAQAS